LNYGRIINNKHTQYARFHELAETYQRTVLEANVEVENAPVAFLKTQQRVRSLKESVEQAKTALERTTEKYVAGAADFNRVFKLQVLLVRQQDQLARSEGGIALNLIAIYKALGGGWQIEPDTHRIAPLPIPLEYEGIPRGEAVEPNEVLPKD
jgi:outer membrane protein TolC